MPNVTVRDRYTCTVNDGVKWHQKQNLENSNGVSRYEPRESLAYTITDHTLIQLGKTTECDKEWRATHHVGHLKRQSADINVCDTSSCILINHLSIKFVGSHIVKRE